MSDKQRVQSICRENIQRGRKCRRWEREASSRAGFIRTSADSSPFSQKFWLRFAATAVSIITLDDRPKFTRYTWELLFRFLFPSFFVNFSFSEGRRDEARKGRAADYQGIKSWRRIAVARSRREVQSEAYVHGVRKVAFFICTARGIALFSFTA